MFASKNRLGNSKDVKLALKLGRSFFNPAFTLKILQEKSLGAVRATVVVSTKVSKLAVKRNRLKRVCREVIKKHLPNFSDTDIVLVLKPLAGKMSETEFINSLQKELQYRYSKNENNLN